MTRLISRLDTQLRIDNLKYSPDFDYMSSHYASMSFPEIGDIDLFKILEPPPKNSSQTTQDELKYLERITNNRSKQDLNLVYSVDEDPLNLFDDIIYQHKLIFPTKFFTAVYYTCVIAIVDHLKFFYNRPRPYQLAEFYGVNVSRIITKTHKTPAYPSGHTMYSTLISEILSDKYPEFTKEFNKITDLCGKGRELQGVHYPSDNQAAKKIVKVIYPELKKYYQGVGHEL